MKFKFQIGGGGGGNKEEEKSKFLVVWFLEKNSMTCMPSFHTHVYVVLLFREAVT